MISRNDILTPNSLCFEAGVVEAIATLDSTFAAASSLPPLPSDRNKLEQVEGNVRETKRTSLEKSREVLFF